MHTPACMCGRTPASALKYCTHIPRPKRNQDSTRKVLSGEYIYQRRILLYEKNIIEEKGETQKNILPIKKNIVPLHTF